MKIKQFAQTVAKAVHQLDKTGWYTSFNQHPMEARIIHDARKLLVDLMKESGYEWGDNVDSCRIRKIKQTPNKP